MYPFSKTTTHFELLNKTKNKASSERLNIYIQFSDERIFVIFIDTANEGKRFRMQRESIGGSKGVLETHPPVQFLLFSCSFWQKNYEIIGFHPLLKSLHPSPHVWEILDPHWKVLNDYCWMWEEKRTG